MITVRARNPEAAYSTKLLIRWHPEQPESNLIQYNVSAHLYGNPHTCTLELWIFGCGKSHLALQSTAYTADEALAFVMWHKVACLEAQTLVDFKKYPLWKGET